jgi:glycyl-tRNA synthetase beta chain
MNNPSFLLEIGTEEIPARFLPGAIEDLRNSAARLLEDYRIGSENIETFATPRRLVLLAENVNAVQRDITKVVFGPSKKAAFDDNGSPTKAAAGFANSLGIKVSDLTVRQKGKNEYVTAVIEEKGLQTNSVLPEIFRKIILSLHFPKTMRWANGNLSFARPIHWILAIFDSHVMDFEIEGIKSNNLTKGHRFLSPASSQVKDIASYMKLLEHNFVILDQQKRKDIIRENMIKLFEASDKQPHFDEDLLTTVTFLVEYPVPVVCSFDNEYLALPKELLITVMKDHQKYFAVRDAEGKLSNDFVVISNTLRENSETVRIGAERVIKARFDDAKFYFNEDMKKSLASRVEDLKQVTFHDRLGTLYEKSQRLTSIGTFLAEKLASSKMDEIVRAALLAKTDLVTGVVREFPELQGTMGKYYSQHDGEDNEVAEALEEQYLPSFLGSTLPQTDVGTMLSLSDKIDNIASFFSIGLVPTGSEDPFALRRQAMGIVSMLLDRGYDISLSEVFANALRTLHEAKKSEITSGTINNFMEQRIEYVLTSTGYDHDLIKAVLPLSSSYPLRTITARIDALEKFKQDIIYSDFLLVIKRVYNIIPEADLPAVNAQLFIQDEEKNLHESLTMLRSEFLPLIEKENYYESLLTLSQITPNVNNFFDRVLVMDKKEEIKTNRLALLKDIWSTAYVLADFSKLI